MQKHHYLPASFLARFSTSVNRSIRDKFLFVGDKNTGTIFKSTAGNTGCVANLYTVTWEIGQNKDFIEQLWNKYEDTLSQAINKLINRTIDGLTWARVLVPFVACMFVRGPDFNIRFNRRMSALGLDEKFSSDDNTNQARMMELQRLLGPVSVAKWIVVNTVGDENLITNDLGYSPFVNILTGDRGVAIPLGLRYVLAIVPQIERKIISIKNGKWEPIIEYTTDFPGNHENLNHAIAGNSQRFIFGHDENIIKKYLTEDQTEKIAPEPEELGFITDPLARAHEFTWHRLVSVLEKEPSEVQGKEFSLDMNEVYKGWAPMLCFPTNLIEFPPALEWLEDGINVKFYDPEFFYLLSRIVMNMEMEAFQDAVEECTRGVNGSYPLEKQCRLLIARSNAYDKMGKYDDAIDDLNKAIELDEKNAIAYSDLGTMFIKKERYDDAIISLSTAIELRPDWGLAYLNRGSAYANKKDLEQALFDYSQFIDLTPKGQIKADGYLNRGNIFTLLNRYEDALFDYGQSIELYENGEEKALAYYRRAAIYYEKKLLLKATGDLKQALVIKQNYFDAYLFLSNIQKQLGKYDEAISTLSEAIPFFTQTEEKAKLHLERGRLLSLTENLEEGMKDFEAANQLSPNNPTTLYNIGVTYLFFAKLSQALEYYDRSLALKPNYPDTLNNHGITQALLGKHQEAIDDFKLAIKYFQENHGKASALRNMAISLALLKKDDLADEAVIAAEKIDPGSIFLYQVKGQLAYHREQFTKAFEFHKIAHKKLIPLKKKNQYLVLPLIHLNKLKEASNLLRSFLNCKPLPIEIFRIKNELLRTQTRYPDLRAVEELLAQTTKIG